MEAKKRLGGRGGFTLLETVLALSIMAVTAVFAVGFLHPQIQLFYDFDRKSRAKAICGQAYGELESALRYGYMYSVDPDEPGRLSYYIRRKKPEGEKANGRVYETLPPVERWPVIAAEDLDVELGGGLKLELDFGGTTGREVRVNMRVMEADEAVYEQKAVIRSMYDYRVEGDG